MAQIQVNGMTVGTDWTTLILQNGLTGASYPIESLGHLTDIQAKQVTSKQTANPIIYGGLPIHRNIYHGWEGSFKWDRYSAAFTKLMLAVMTTAQQTGEETYWTLWGSIINAAVGNTDELMFQFLVLDDHDVGN